MPAYHACTAFDVMHRLNIHLQFFGAGTADPNLEAFNKSACGAAEQVWRRSKSLLWGGEAGTANPNLESFKKLRAGPHSKSGGVQKSPLGGKVLAQPIQIWRRSPKIARGATQQMRRRSKTILWGSGAGTANPSLETFKKSLSACVGISVWLKQ